MKLGHKTLLTLVTASSVTIALSYIVLQATIYETFVELESKSAVQNAETIEAEIRTQLDSLVVLNTEYSQWNDSFNYLRDAYPEYITQNISTDTMDYLDLDAFVLLDPEGNLNLSFARGLNHTFEFQSRLPYVELDSVIEALAVGDNGANQLAGVLGTTRGPMLLTSRAVTRSDGSGPPAGSLLFIRMLNESRIERLEEKLNIEFSAMAIDAAQHELPMVTEDNRVLTYTLISDIVGRPGFVLEVVTPREISGAGASAVMFAMLFLALTSLLYLFVTNQFVKHMIVAPVSRLTQYVGRLQESGNLSERHVHSRDDELGTLTRQTNSLVEQLELAQDQMADARDTALRASKAKSEFLATMSHEIRTPINGVLGMTELLLDSKGLSEKQRRYAATVQQSGNSLLHVINDILDISKIEAGKVELDIAPFNLRDSVEDCLELLAESAHRKGLEIVAAISLDTHTYVQGDSVRLNQILTNLIGNAVKFTEDGEIVVTVTDEPDHTGTSNYRFEIKDTGIGINQENKENLFDPFSQEDSSTTRRFGGTGLGLSISKRLIELMDGEIGVDSVSGQGSTFWFTANLTKDEETSQSPRPELLSEKKVLIVDDNATNREILRHQLEGWQMRVEESSCGAEALSRLAEDSGAVPIFDIVLLDMNMPEMDGLQLAEAIRNRPGYDHIPLVMLSSMSVADNDDERGAARLDAWLTKPVRQARLLDTLVSLFTRQALDTQVEDSEQPPQITQHDDSVVALQILLAEDNDVNQSVAVAMLESLGHEITLATNGREAVSAFQSQDFDLVFMDCHMPELDGYDATRTIRVLEDQQNFPATPIVALTANALDGDRERCIASGMTDYLSKPFTKKQLKEKITLSFRADGLNDEDIAEDMPKSQGRILIVEDDAVNQQVAKASLESLGHDVTVAHNGDDALRMMSQEQFDLVLMDCHMPVRDGYDTTKEIRRREKRAGNSNRIPIVAVTADFLESNRQRCRDCGMDDYVTKPFTQEYLRIVLARWLDHSVGDSPTPSISIDSDGFSKLGETTTLASINSEMLQELHELDPSPGCDIVREIIVSYCATSTNMILRLRNAIGENDCENIELIAHSLKGTSGQVGATLLASLCDQLITSARQNDLSDAPSLCERAAIEHAAVISGLHSELQRMAA